MLNPNEIAEHVETVYLSCAELSTADRLRVMQLAWLLVASNARTEALSVPGGFPEEQARQVKQPRSLADLIEQDQPDLEAERLFHEGDIDAMLRHFQQRLNDGPSGDD